MSQELPASPGAADGADVRAATAAVRAELGRLSGLLARGSRVSDEDLLASVSEVSHLRAQVEAVYLGVVREVDSRGLAGPGVSPPTASTSEGLVRMATGATPAAARRDVAAARATAPGAALEGFGALLAAGDVSREHVDAAVRVMDRIPAHLAADDDARTTIADFLRTVAVDAHASPRELDRAGRRLLARLDPDGDDSFDPQAQDRRFLDVGTDATGMVVGSFQLDPIAGATLRAAIDAYAAPRSTQDGGAPDGPDTLDGRDAGATSDPRSARQRRADALATIADIALGAAAPQRGERPRVVVHTSVGHLAGLTGDLATTEAGEVLPPGVTARLSCDAVLQRVTVEPTLGPLEVGREHRLVTTAQRRALAARDGGCVICQAPPHWCDAHHRTHWARGGSTDLSNLVLLCGSHHTAVHAGQWQLIDDERGGLLVVPPRWVDPLRRPRRPTRYATDEAIARLSGDLLPGADPPHPSQRPADTPPGDPPPADPPVSGEPS